MAALSNCDLFLRWLGYRLFLGNWSVSFVSLEFLPSYLFGNRLTSIYYSHRKCKRLFFKQLPQLLIA
jgi:hypothetical protein